MHNGDEISLCDQSKFNTQIDSLNQSYQTQIPRMPKFWSQVDLENLKNWGKILRKKAEEEERKRREKEISLKVEQRFSMMKNNKKRMLQSLLNRPYNKVTIDRVLLKEDSHYQNQELISDESDVKEQVISHFQKQFRKRKQKFKEMSKEWRKEYEPKKDVDPIWYGNIMNPINEEDWSLALYKTQNNTAPGISCIGYILFKKLSAEATKSVIKFTNLILEEGRIPDKWKLG